jgi:Protein of unknown function (DUF6044)
MRPAGETLQTITGSDRSRSGWEPAARLLSRHPWLVYAVATFLAFPVLEMVVHGQNALQYAHDVFDDDIPRLFAIATDWQTYGPSLWDTHLTAGNALFAQFALPPLTPDVLLSFVVPPFLAYAINLAGIAFIAGLGMHLFLRDSLRLRGAACFAGGLIAAFAFWHYILGYAPAMFPLILWSADRALERKGRRWPLVLAVVVAAFAIGAGLLQIVVLDVAAAVPYVVVRGRARGSWRRDLTTFGFIWTLAALLAAPIIVSVLTAVPGSQRSILDLAYTNPPFVEAVKEAVHRYSSIVFGIGVRGTLGAPGDIYGTYFVGAIGLPFLALSVARPRNGVQRYLLLLLVAIPIIDLGADLAVPVLQHIPVAQSFKFVRVRHLVPALVAINAALGLDWLMTASAESLSRRRGLAAVGLVAVAFMALAWQGVVAVQRALAGIGSTLVHRGWIVVSVALAGGLTVVAAVAIFLAARLLWRRGTPQLAIGKSLLPLTLAAVLVLGLAGERFLWARGERYLDGNLGSWAADVVATPGLAFIAAQPDPGRVLLIGEHANRAMSAGLDTVGGYETIYPLRYHYLFDVLIGPQLAIDPTDRAYYEKWGNRVYAFGPLFDAPIADLLGVRWVYAQSSTVADPSLVPRFQGADVTVYENPGAFPRAFLVHSVDVVADEPALLSALGAASATDLRTTAYLSRADAGDLTLPGGPAAVPADQATVIRDTPDEVVVSTSSSTDGLLILADTYDGGWTADVDGQPARIVPTDEALRGVAVPAGTHRVTFRYRPIPTLAAIGVSGATGLGLVAWWIAGMVEERRRRRVFIGR